MSLTVEERASALKEIQGECRRGELVAAPVGRPPEQRSDRGRLEKLLMEGAEPVRRRSRDSAAEL